MANFRRAVPTLAELSGLAVFHDMARDGIARPITLEVGREAIALSPPGCKGQCRTALKRLWRSKRYLEAVVADGAQRYDANGYPVGPVSADNRLWALDRLETKRLETAAKFQTDQKWAKELNEVAHAGRSVEKPKQA